jgi:hypothetical protein
MITNLILNFISFIFFIFSEINLNPQILMFFIVIFFLHERNVVYQLRTMNYENEPYNSFNDLLMMNCEPHMKFDDIFIIDHEL